MRHLDKAIIKNVIEVGARYGDESIELSKIFNSAKIYSFECNPLTVDICKENLKNYDNISFFDYGLGEAIALLPFYSYINNNDGASSFYKRIDFDKTQEQTGIIKINTLKDFSINHNIKCVDLLCMDVQGFELNILKGASDFIKNIKYIIMEEPNPIINSNYLPDNIYSKYIHAPSSKEIYEFMINNGFELIERVEENKIEDNVMYKNLLYI